MNEKNSDLLDMSDINKYYECEETEQPIQENKNILLRYPKGERPLDRGLPAVWV